MKSRLAGLFLLTGCENQEKKQVNSNLKQNTASDIDKPFLKTAYVHCRQFVNQAFKKAHHHFSFRMCNVEVF